MAPFDELPPVSLPDLPTSAQGAAGVQGALPSPLLAGRESIDLDPTCTPADQPPEHSLPATGTTRQWLEVTLVLLVLALAFLLASFPARNSDLWMHLASGRLLVQGEYSFATDYSLPSGLPVYHSWVYDLLCYGVYSVMGGWALVVCKALLVVGIAFLLLHLSRVGQGWWVPVFCTSIALVAMSARLLLQPATVSYLFLALTLWLLLPRDEAPGKRSSQWLTPMLLLGLFVLWANVDSWFVLGLGIVALVWLGEALDAAFGASGPPGDWLALLLRRGLCFALLAAACLFNPMHVHAFALPPELAPLGPVGSPAAHLAPGQFSSPFQGAYFASVGRTPAGLAYFVLLGLALVSFFLNLPRWRWQRFLPWIALAALSAVQARAVPFFAVVTGPVLAWNLQEFFARAFENGQWQTPAWSRRILAGHALTVGLVLILPCCAWPGWLQVPPFGPRSWAVEVPPSLVKGAATTSRWLQEGKLGSEARGLHLSPETAHAFAWFCPEANGLRDEGLAAAVRGDQEAPADWDQSMHTAGINYVILYDFDHGRLYETMDRLLEDPQQWPLLYVEGYVAVFGWRDPAATKATDHFQGRQLDLNHLAFHPPADKKAPAKAPSARPEPRSWWEALWKPVPPRPIEQDEATLHLMHAELLRRTAPQRHLDAWESSQSAALVVAAGGWSGPGGLFDARMRLTLLRPRLPDYGSRFDTLPGPDQLAHALQRQFAVQRDDTSPALLYLAVRAARRALAVNPDDAQAYLVLGESYMRLLDSTRERAWGRQMPELVELRRAQASAALNQAVALKPDLAQAHFSLSQLYEQMEYLDLMLDHLRAYVRLTRAAGPPPGVSAELFNEQQAYYEAQVSQLTKELEKRGNRFEVASAGWKVLDRAQKAMQEGLAGKARDLLLESHVSAFGPRGMGLELELLLRTGRQNDVLDWTGPEQRARLGSPYHWLRAEALAATGDYSLAEEECKQLSRSLAVRFPGQDVSQVRDIMAQQVAQRLFDEMPSGSILDLLRRTFDRFEFINRVMSLRQALRQEADVTVLRGLLLLEEGEVDEAEIAFREALSFWKDAASAASGGGLDFQGRAVAQGCLEWLE